MANVLLAGTLLTGAGVAVVGATVEVFDRDTTTPVRATFTGGTDANGEWNFSYAPGANSRRVDVRITNLSSISFLKYDDQLQVSSLETASLRIINPAFTFEYDIVPAAIVAARQLNLPLLTATDTLVVLALAQTLTNKTLTSPVIDTQITGTAVATQAQMEAETANVVVAANLLKNSPGVAKAWCRITTAGALESPSYNITSITDTGAGDRTIVWGTDFSTSVYVVVSAFHGSPTSHLDNYNKFITPAVGSIIHQMFVNSVAEDVSTALSAFGDQ